MNEKLVIDTLKELASKAQFVSFLYRCKQAGELARHTVIYGASYDNQLRKSLEALDAIRPALNHPILILAAQQLKESFEESLKSHSLGRFHPDYRKPDSYVDIVPGLKFCISNRTINVTGLQHRKTVIEEGERPIVNSRPLTIAKRALRSELPIGRFREFIILPEYMQSVTLQGDTIYLKLKS